MQNHARTAGATEQQIGLFITTEQESSHFTLETRWPGVSGAGFTETSPGSGLWSRTEIARQGEFTFIDLPAGQSSQGDIAVQSNGDTDEADRQKGLFITAEMQTMSSLYMCLVMNWSPLMRTWLSTVSFHPI